MKSKKLKVLVALAVNITLIGGMATPSIALEKEKKKVQSEVKKKEQ